MIKSLFGAAVALGVLASPASAQMTNTTDSSAAPMAEHQTMTSHSMHRTTHMTTMHHMGRGHMSTMQWCNSMSHKRAMRYKSCRSMMMMHHGHMHHHHMMMHKKAM